MNKKELDKFMKLMDTLEDRYRKKNDSNNAALAKSGTKAMKNLMSFCMLKEEWPEIITPVKKDGKVGFLAMWSNGIIREFYDK